MLYVALTRAKEKLILVGSWEDPARTAEKLALELTERGPAPYTVRQGKNAAQWLLLCAHVPPRWGESCASGPRPRRGCVFWQDYTPWRVGISQYQPQGETCAPEARAPEPADLALLERLRLRAAHGMEHQPL